MAKDDFREDEREEELDDELEDEDEDELEDEDDEDDFEDDEEDEDELEERTEAAKKKTAVRFNGEYDEESNEAWAMIKDFVTDPTHWLIFGIVVLLIVAMIFTLKFLIAIRAPAVPNGEGVSVVSGDTPQVDSPEPLLPEEIDDSNTVQPILSGARKEDYYTFLLTATDASSSNTDTLMIVSYDVKNQKLNLMSIPRDTMVNVSWDIKKINSVYGMSGMNALKKHIGKLIGFIPDYYVKIDLNAFIEVVDLIGGVDFDVPRAMNYDDPVQNLHIHFQPGMQHLTGQQAMEVVRWRKDNRSASGSVAGYDDTGRIETQQAFLRAALKQALSIRNWTKITGYVEIFNRDVDSDLELGNMLWFARKAMDLKEEDFTACTIPGNYFGSAWSRTTQSMQSYVTLYPQQVIALVNESFNPYLTNVSMANLDIMSINADGSVRSSTGYVADSIAALPPVRPADTAEETPDDEQTPDDILPGEQIDANANEHGTEGTDTNEHGATGTDANEHGTTENEPAEHGGEVPGETVPEPAPEPEPEHTDTTPTEPGGDE